MRFKFRVWKSLGKEYSNEFIHDTTIENGTITIRVPNHCVLEQYIGTKDKNNKEIFVGDIVKAGSFMFAITQRDVSISKKLRDDTVEVIGNINENKDLLKC